MDIKEDSSHSITTFDQRKYFEKEAHFKWQKFEDTFQLTIHRADADHLHDLRVATRRLMAMIQFRELFYPSDTHKRLLKSLKQLMTPLGEQRDLFLQEDYLSQFIHPLRGSLTLFHGQLRKELLNNHKSIRTTLKKFSCSTVQRQVYQTIMHWDSTPALPGVSTPPDSLEQVNWKRLIQENAHQVLSLEQDVFVNRNMKALHRMRIKIKKLRYFLEIIMEIEPFIREEQLTRLARIQTRMGTIHDMDVLALHLLDFSRGLYPNQSGHIDIGNAVQKIKLHRQRQIPGLKKEYELFARDFSPLMD